MAKELTVWIDGACEPVNPGGVASYGLLVKDGDIVLLSEGGIVGRGPKFSNNVAEYCGLLALVGHCISGRLDKLARHLIHSDSMLLVNLMSNKWRANSGLYKPYHLEAVDKISKHHLNFTYKWIPREENIDADHLSKKYLLEVLNG